MVTCMFSYESLTPTGPLWGIKGSIRPCTSIGWLKDLSTLLQVLRQVLSRDPTV